MTTAILWFRRDLRLSDNPALVEAIASADDVVGVFCLDQRLLASAGATRRAFLHDSLRSLHESMDGALVVRSGDPVEVIPSLAVEVDAASVHVAADFGPYGRRRDDVVADAVASADIEFVRTGSPYAVDPGSIFTKAGTPYRVFTPFSRVWRDHGWDDPVRRPSAIPWRRAESESIPTSPDTGDVELPAAGEDEAHRRLDRFLRSWVDRYDDDRDRPDRDATSRLSPDLKWGAVHPRQILARLGSSAGERTFATELCWRDFYADVLFHDPDSARTSMNERVGSMPWDTGEGADESFEAWATGQTGYPIVDAGMRQLLAEGWMHNRVRMLVASFLVKDLHLDWRRGARWFMQHLVDGDLASNQHGWQWTAGTGTDAAPYFRIFNPTVQAERFDPDGDYVRRYVAELADVAGGAVHRPWELDGGPPAGYPLPIVDHAEERDESLRRYQATGS
ncbi:cryptochrome/photolyase family protein [Actinospongicola halichondriae]|uniref:cryptochrome/photolyase family protein n=1 Tax=Actinospongicola halichondriae TaxID=3236844 RepID=UPI003D578658